MGANNHTVANVGVMDEKYRKFRGTRSGLHFWQFGRALVLHLLVSGPHNLSRVMMRSSLPNP